jgi:hypothetical protein
VRRIQAQWRASCMRRRFEGMRMSATIVQSVYRGHQYRTAQVRPTTEVQDIHGVATVLETFDAATVRIQAWWRMTSAVCSYRSVLFGCARSFCRLFTVGLWHGSISNARGWHHP